MPSLNAGCVQLRPCQSVRLRPYRLATEVRERWHFLFPSVTRFCDPMPLSDSVEPATEPPTPEQPPGRRLVRPLADEPCQLREVRLRVVDLGHVWQLVCDLASRLVSKQARQLPECSVASNLLQAARQPTGDGRARMSSGLVDSARLVPSGRAVTDTTNVTSSSSATAIAARLAQKRLS